MRVNANFVLPACRRVRATVPRGRLVAMGFVVGALAIGIAALLTSS